MVILSMSICSQAGIGIVDSETLRGIIHASLGMLHFPILVECVPLLNLCDVMHLKLLASFPNHGLCSNTSHPEVQG